jgi:alpha-glucuronidase
MKIRILVTLLTLLSSINLHAEDGYRLWLRYDKIDNPQRLTTYTQSIKGLMLLEESPTLSAAQEELELGLKGLLGQDIAHVTEIKTDGTIIVGKTTAPLLAKLDAITNSNLNEEGFLIFSTTINKKKVTVITGKEDVGVLYGVFHFLQLLQTQQDIANLKIES